MGFDFSSAGGLNQSAPSANINKFIVKLVDQGLILDQGDAYALIPTMGLPPLSLHLILKMMLNALSTLVIGRLGRYDGNLMTWVKPSNHKLVDRAIRYADILLKKKGISRSYIQLAEACFYLKGKIPENQSLVYAMVDRLSEG